MRETLVKTEEFKDSPVGRIPKDWDVVPCSTAFSLASGEAKTQKTLEAEHSGKVAVYGGNGIIGYTHTPLIKHATIVIGRVGEYCGRVHLITQPVWVTDNALYATNFAPDFYLGFIYRYLEWFDLTKVRSQTGQPLVTQGAVGNVFIVKPHENEQRRIVEILDTIDSTIAHTSSLIAKLKQMKAGLLHDLLTRGLDENGELRDAITHPEQFKDSPLGQVPKDWEVVPIQQAAAQVPGATTIGPFGSNLLASDYRSVGVPVTFVRDIKADGFQWNSNIYVEPKKARELSAHSVQSGDLLATKMGLPPCIACVYPEWMASGIITADIIRLRPNTQISTSQWLSLFINSNAIIRQVRGITGGITRDKITLHDFRRLLIALPSLKEQKQIINILDTYNSRICCEEAYREKLKFQKQGLMHDLLTGKVRVKNA